LKSGFLDVLIRKTVCRPPPIWMMRQAGRYLPEYRQLRDKAGSFLGLCANPELAAEVSLQPVQRFDFDAAIIFSDILTVPMALGHVVTFDEGPKLAPLTTIGGLERDPVRWRKALSPVYQALGLARGALAPEKALIGFAGAPWTLAVYLAGGGHDEQKAARLWAYSDPDAFQALIDLLVDCVSQHLIWQLEAGAQVVQLFDSWAGGLPPVLFDRFVIAPTKAIVDRVRAVVPGAPIIGFPRGAGLPALLAYAGKTGVDGISLDPAIDLDYWGDHWGKKPAVVLQGNLDPLALLAGGKALQDGVAAILGATRNTPFIFNLGHGVLPATPVAHVEQLVKQVRSAS
jgi:uroporphyrinogen decarboxylase